MSQFDIMVSINADTREQAEQMVASKLGAVYPLSAPYPADGPAKVFGFGPPSHEESDQTGDYYEICDGCGESIDPEEHSWPVCLKGLREHRDRLLDDRIPVVDRMHEAQEGTKGAIRREQKALARAEKAEEQLRKLHESYDFVHEGRGKQRERAEQAERERDAMHAAAEELRACVMMQNSSDAGHAFTWAPSWDAEWTIGGTYRCSSTAAQCRQLYERGMAAEKARLIEVSAGNLPPIEVPDVFGMLSERLGYTKPARPPCVPSHIPDTDWTVIEGRAVWREDDWLRIADSDPRQIAWLVLRDEECLSKGPAFRADVPQSLFLAARRWMGWERALTPVDLTELREAWKNWTPGTGGLDGFNELLAAVEKLLSLGGAP